VERTLTPTPAPDVFVAPGAELVGDVRLASECSIWFGASVRGIEGNVDIGPQANVQDNCVIEATPGHPVRIGARTSVGHNARVIGATVDESALIAIGARVLPGARVGKHCIVAANATVPEDMIVPPRKLVIGNGRLAREVTAAEIDRIEGGATGYVRLCHEFLLGRAETVG
jgi:carbonic anhydrase/acetyltransferase-like protein (isoleucine patch superfamily)